MIPDRLWDELGLSPVAELHGGHQSKVFLASDDGDSIVVKLVAASGDHKSFRQRVSLTRRLADENPAVVGPLETDDGFTSTVEGWHVVRYPYIDGTRPNPGNRDHVERMATTLAGLHASMADVAGQPLPPVPALEDVQDRRLTNGQLIHGDYAPANLVATKDGLRVIDFDDCGHGSISFDVGNTLYMMLFDAWCAQQPDLYRQFRLWFVGAYRSATTSSLDDDLLDRAIAERTQALRRWLAVPGEAPVGIRNASPAWRRKLHSFTTEAASIDYNV